MPALLWSVIDLQTASLDMAGAHHCGLLSGSGMEFPPPISGRQDGTISLWDLRVGTLLWSGSMEGQGVCGLAFDRRGIVMNKAYAAGMGGRLATINLRPCQPDQGRAMEVQQV